MGDGVTSTPDVSVQAAVRDLRLDLRRKFALEMLFIHMRRLLHRVLPCCDATVG